MRLSILLFTFATFFIQRSAFSRQEYKVGVENIDFYPYHKINERGEYVGFARDLLDAFAQYEHITFVYEIRSVQRLAHEYLTEKKIGFKFPDNPGWHAKYKPSGKFTYSDPVLSGLDGTIVKKEFKDQPLSFFNKKKFGIIKGFNTFSFDHTGVVLSVSTDLDVLIDRLIYSQVDGIYTNIDLALAKIKDIPGAADKFAYNKKLPHCVEDHMLSSYSHADIIADFNTYLSKNKSFVDNLKNRYGIK